MSNSIEQAINLIKQFALAAQEDKAAILAQLEQTESKMSVVEQCQYAFELSATLQGTSVEEVEEQFGFGPIQLEFRPREDRQRLITVGRNSLVFHFTGEAMKQTARSVLTSLGDTKIDPDDRALLTTMAMTEKGAKPGALMN